MLTAWIMTGPALGSGTEEVKRVGSLVVDSQL